MSRGSRIQSHGTPEQAASRARMAELFEETPLPRDELMVNLALYTRASVMAKVLYLDELYRLIEPVPGVILEFGTWWGANLALFETLRAIREPYNFRRRIVGFDTFAGYAGISDADRPGDAVRERAYSVSPGYREHLEQVLECHRRENPMGHLPRFELVEGDASETIGPWLEAHPETIVGLAYFDMQLYEPTRRCLDAIRPHLTRGSVIALDELGAPEFPGETVAFREAFGLDRYELRRSRYLPDRTYLVVR